MIEIENLRLLLECKITDSVNRDRKAIMPKYTKTRLSVCNQRAVAVNFVQNDSVYIHGKRLMVTENNRIIRAYNNVRFYKTDMSGRSDSLYLVQKP
jgi:hypothetical protein